MTLDELLRLLPDHQAVTGQYGPYVARCPAHADVIRSLQIRPGADGELAVRCHAGCRTEDVLAALGKTRADLLGRPPEPTGEPTMTGRTDGLGDEGLTVTYEVQAQDRLGVMVPCLNCGLGFPLRRVALTVWACAEEIGFVGACCLHPDARAQFATMLELMEPRAAQG
ncbi:MAG: hypothetical protein WD690_13960 [Vicinamibacterales bacterium]